MCALFLSTPSARRATDLAGWIVEMLSISIHALREEGDPRPVRSVRCGRISIHALREEGDAYARGSAVWSTDFYPRPPRGGRHNAMLQSLSIGTISIHALREEGDPLTGAYSSRFWTFLSTPSARRATKPW